MTSEVVTSHPVEIITQFKNDKMKLPSFAHADDAAVDLQANYESPFVAQLDPHKTLMVPTGILISLPTGGLDFRWVMDIRPRSGLAKQQGVTVINSPGTIDQGYRGEICVLLHNEGKDTALITAGMRVAQMILSKAYRFHWVEVESFTESDTTRGSAGFGSTGT